MDYKAKIEIDVQDAFDELALENTYGEGEWVSLEEDGISFDRYNEGKNVLYIGW